jgi:hypothetical protein
MKELSSSGLVDYFQVEQRDQVKLILKYFTWLISYYCYDILLCINNLCIIYFLSLPEGIFFILPCIDTYRKVDLRVVSFDVPPQEVKICAKEALGVIIFNSRINF